jgi:bacterial/archaeal transporter family-2 protein
MSWSVGLAILFGLIGGLVASGQSGLANSISQRTGIPVAAFLIHIAGSLVAGLVVWITRQPIPLTLVAWGPLLGRALFAGAFGVIILSSVAFSVGRLGTTAALSLFVAAQLIGAVIIDRFGLLDQPVRYLTLPRLAGVLLLIAGTYLVVRR